MVFKFISAFILMASVISPVVMVSGCDEVKENSTDPAVAFLAAREAYDDEYYELALPKLQEFRARFPYSKYAKQAMLLIADSHFQMDDFPDAAAVYEQFVKLHPSDSQADFARFRVGLCYWKEAPEELDREQENTENAIKVWSDLERDFPKSKYLSEAKGYMKIGQRRIAEADHFVAKFYCKLEKWSACAYRSMEFVEKHSTQKDLLKDAARLGEKAFMNLASELEAGEMKGDANLFAKSMTPEQMKAKSKELGIIHRKL